MKLDSLARRYRRRPREGPVEVWLRVRGFNRRCEPSSQLGVLRWVENSVVPGVAPDVDDTRPAAGGHGIAP